MIKKKNSIRTLTLILKTQFTVLNEIRLHHLNPLEPEYKSIKIKNLVYTYLKKKTQK